jgi:hypothetical protein
MAERCGEIFCCEKEGSGGACLVGGGGGGEGRGLPSSLSVIMFEKNTFFVAVMTSPLADTAARDIAGIFGGVIVLFTLFVFSAVVLYRTQPSFSFAYPPFLLCICAGCLFVGACVCVCVCVMH